MKRLHVLDSGARRGTRTAAVNAAMLLLALLPCGRTAMAVSPDSVVHSRHNLSATSASTIRATGEQQICVFCHTPHGAHTVQPLWNRSVPATTYRVYSSRTLEAVPGQPTGTSKLCLSCHDGTIAIGSILSRGQPVSMAKGTTRLPPGHKANLGTDLSDDHPISFTYDRRLVGKDPKLNDPAGLPPSVRLDSGSQMQCATCHDAHNNKFGNFLVMDNQRSQLCITCHRMENREMKGHDQCANCHQPHTAPSGPFLLRAAKVAETCTRCHDGQHSPAQDVASDIRKRDRHETHSSVAITNPAPDNTSCSDCHEPHTMTKTTATAPLIAGSFGKIAGIDANGSALPVARYEYEVCFRCHGDQPAKMVHTITRQIAQPNVRLQFALLNPSFHPVEGPGKNMNVPSLRPGLTTGTTIYCNDCHRSDAAGGAGPTGTHGSAFPGLLAAQYETRDGTVETEATYALCYSCHDRNNILANKSFVGNPAARSIGGHKEHIVDQKTPCSICHDSHGISSTQGTQAKNAHLINFDTSAVLPDPATGRLEYQSLGVNSGQCFLSCHGYAHSPSVYGSAGQVQAAKAMRARPRNSPAPAPAPRLLPAPRK